VGDSVKTADLEDEYRAAVRALTTEDAVELVDELGIPFFLVIIHQMVGVLPIRFLDKGKWLWEPDPESSRFAYITPVRVDRHDTPLSDEAWGMPRMGALIDLIAWHPAASRRFALRTALSPWLGCVPWGEPFPALIRDTPLSWLQGDCDGLVLLTRKPAQLRSILAEFEYGVQTETDQLAAKLNRLIRQPLDNAPLIQPWPPGGGPRPNYESAHVTPDQGNYTPLREGD
jgi:hypothetical protein